MASRIDGGSRAREAPGIGYEVSRVRGDASLIDPIAAEWTALMVEGPCDEPFYGPAWVRAWLDTFAPGTPLTLLTIRRDGQLRGILPLVERRFGIGPLGLRWARSAANVHFPRFDVVHGAGDRDEVTAALWAFLQGWTGWDILQFESAPDTGVAWRLLDLAGAGAAGHQVRRHLPDASPWVDVTQFPRGIEAILTTRSSNLRSQLRKAIKRARGMGEIDFRVVTSDSRPDAIDDAVASFYRLEASGWKGEAGTAILSDPATRDFYDLIVADARTTGSFMLGQLWIGDELIAAELKLLHGDTLYELKSGYDEAHGRLSPGHLTKAYTIDAALERDVTVLDNCGRADPHKLGWTDQVRPFAVCYLFNRTPRGRLAYAALFQVGPRIRKRLARYPLPGPIRRFLT